MKIKKTFLPILTTLMMFVLAMIPPTELKIPARPVTAFSGSIIFGNVDTARPEFVEYYINHEEQSQVIPITYDGQGHASYHVNIPMQNIPNNSTVAFKIDDVIFGFGELNGKHNILDLSEDQQGGQAGSQAQ